MKRVFCLFLSLLLILSLSLVSFAETPTVCPECGGNLQNLNVSIAFGGSGYLFCTHCGKSFFTDNGELKGYNDEAADEGTYEVVDGNTVITRQGGGGESRGGGAGRVDSSGCITIPIYVTRIGYEGTETQYTYSCSKSSCTTYGASLFPTNKLTCFGHYAGTTKGNTFKCTYASTTDNPLVLYGDVKVAGNYIAYKQIWRSSSDVWIDNGQVLNPTSDDAFISDPIALTGSISYQVGNQSFGTLNSVHSIVQLVVKSGVDAEADYQAIVRFYAKSALPVNSSTLYPDGYYFDGCHFVYNDGGLVVYYEGDDGTIIGQSVYNEVTNNYTITIYNTTPSGGGGTGGGGSSTPSGGFLDSFISGLFGGLADLVLGTVKLLLKLFFDLIAAVFGWFVSLSTYLTSFFGGLFPADIVAILVLVLPLALILGVIKFIRG